MEKTMAQIVWQVRRANKVYGPGMSDDPSKACPYPFDEYVGTDLPADFEGEVVRRVSFDTPKYATDGWVPHISQKEYTEMYSGGDSGG